MNNKEFSKLLKEWKQKNQQEDLEENFLKKAAAGAFAAGLGMANPAVAAEPAEKPAQVQVQKKELKDLKSLSEQQKYVLGIYLQSLENSMSNNIETAANKLKSLRGLINNNVQLNEKAIQMAENAKQQDPAAYRSAIKLAEDSISNEVRYEIDVRGGTEMINKMQKQSSPEEERTGSYGADAFDKLQGYTANVR